MTTATCLSRGRHRAARAGRDFGAVRRFLRATFAVALGGGGVWAGVLGLAFASWGSRVAALELAALSGVLLGCSWVLALDPGEAWQYLTRTQPPNPSEKTHV